MATLRKRGFRLPALEPERAPKAPRAAAITIVVPDAVHVPLPPALTDRLLKPNLVIGFDIETHDWEQVDRHAPYIGQFGWEYNRADTALDFSRVVQIGWAISPVDMSTPVEVKTELIRPAGFLISERATKFHGITHDYAVQEGRPLDQVLTEFIADVVKATAQGGRICAHQIETVGGEVLHPPCGLVTVSRLCTKRDG
jgi:hypothetical protein